MKKVVLVQNNTVICLTSGKLSWKEFTSFEEVLKWLSTKKATVMPFMLEEDLVLPKTEVIRRSKVYGTFIRVWPERLVKGNKGLKEILYLLDSEHASRCDENH